MGTNFLIHENHLNHNRALASVQNLQELNPLVKVSAEEASIEEKLSNDAFWSRFSIVFLCNVKLSEQIKVNDICRRRNILFFSAETFGLLATMFQDAISFDYHVKNPTTKETKSFHKDYISLSEALSTNLSSVNRLSKTWIGVQCKCVCVCFVFWPICVCLL
ncbi:ThiF family protein [compost metagenome]